jgi:hypothetical protein
LIPALVVVAVIEPWTFGCDQVRVVLLMVTMLPPGSAMVRSTRTPAVS